LSNTPLEVYKKLLHKFGPQCWWPTTSSGEIVPKYRKRNTYGKLSDREKFEICVGAILTQNTSWKNVEKALENLNKKKLIGADKIASLDIRKLAKFIRPSGYYNQKAKRLKAFAKYISDNYKGKLSSLFSKSLRSARKELLELHGIGPETADSMLLYAGNRPSFVVDAYTVRLGERLGWFKNEDYQNIKEFFESRLPKSTVVYKEFHALIVALGKDYCRKRPLCDLCLLIKGCKRGLRHTSSFAT